MPLTVDDAKKIMAEVKANEAKLAACDSHLFELAADSRKHDPRWRCQHCGGTITGLELHWYMVGAAHGAKKNEAEEM